MLLHEFWLFFRFQRTIIETLLLKYYTQVTNPNELFVGELYLSDVLTLIVKFLERVFLQFYYIIFIFQYKNENIFSIN